MALPDPLPFLLVTARLAGLVVMSPVFGHGLVPMRVRAGLVGVLALALAPAVATPALDGAPSALTVLWLVAVEGAIGACLGLVAQLVVTGVQLGGHVAGVQIGFGVGSAIDPGTETGAGLIAQWQQLVALLAFLALDVHHMVLRALVESFRIAPVGAAVLDGPVLASVVAEGAGLFAVGVRIAAPVLVVLVLVNGGLAVLARTIPQANALAVGLPANVAIGLVVVGASLPFTMGFVARTLRRPRPRARGARHAPGSARAWLTRRRTGPATPARRDEARRRGRVATSPAVAPAAIVHGARVRRRRRARSRGRAAGDAGRLARRRGTDRDRRRLRQSARLAHRDRARGLPRSVLRPGRDGRIRCHGSAGRAPPAGDAVRSGAAPRRLAAGTCRSRGSRAS
jgi:flagellar biosynthetic protein FliR